MTFRDIMENWQSAIRILTDIWQVAAAGLSILWYVGSPQSKEGDERMLNPNELHMKLKIKYLNNFYRN